MTNHFNTRDEDGASAVEYALLVAAIAAILVVIIFAVGLFTQELFNDTCDSLDSASTLHGAGSC